jgi:hypothetical protein
MREYFNWLILKKDRYTPLEDLEYYKRFGIEQENDKYVVKNKDLLEKAYEKAWANRNFEIDKFWTRAAYFWGFIVLIFGAYIAISTSDHAYRAIKMHLDLYLLLLGLLFSLAWLLNIFGSKSWQRNWEAHIDWLEDFVSGPIYKTIYFSGNRFYSVSKLTEVMAFVVIIVWIGLLSQYLIENYTLSYTHIKWIPTIAIFITIIVAIVLIFGYCSGGYKSQKDKFIDRWE